MKRKTDWSQIGSMIIMAVLLFVAWIAIVKLIDLVPQLFNSPIIKFAKERQEIYNKYYIQRDCLSQLVKQESDRIEQECRRELKELDEREKEKKNGYRKGTDTKR